MSPFEATEGRLKDHLLWREFMYAVKIGQAAAQVPHHRVSVIPEEGRSMCSVVRGSCETAWGMP